ncbi:MAG: aspartate/glutamate racemase family protein, partial [Anaerovoracaceae bacterium]
PIINMVEVTVDGIRERLGDKDVKVGIMATDGTIESNLYQSECFDKELIPVTPSKAGQEKVMEIIYDYIKAGKAVPKKLFEEVEEEFAMAGCSCVIMACTELSCYKKERELSDFYVDAMEVLSKVAIVLCDKRLKC